jgi:hypothetical protein
MSGSLFALLGTGAIALSIAIFGTPYNFQRSTMTDQALTPKPHLAAATHQGIQGKVSRLAGNQMPGVGQSNSPAQPVKTVVWVFSGTIPTQNSPRWSVSAANNHPQKLGIIATNEQGEFSAELPVGEYTVFAESGSDLYLNHFSGDGNFGTVKVTANAIARVRLENTENAAF